MTIVRLPTPLRPYAEGKKEVQVSGANVREALADLTRLFPGLTTHLYSEERALRAYVNIFRNEEDVRTLQGEDTPLTTQDRLLIVPSIAGGAGGRLPSVDYSALRTNQAIIIATLLAGFVLDFAWVPAVVGFVMLLGSILRRPGFLPVYRLLRDRLVRPDPVPDRPEPHLFAQALGGAMLIVSFDALSVGYGTLGWGLTWLVVALAGLNLFGGFCVGCAIYYWLHRLRIPGFRFEPPAGAAPGRRPPAERG